MYTKRNFFHQGLSYFLTAILFNLLLFPVMGSDKQESKPMINGIYRENIHTVQFFRAGWDFSQPVIELGSDQRLLFKFDEVADGVTNFNYTIMHCDADWFPSRLVQSEYMEGFIDNPVTDYAASINTTLQFTNYQLSLPNEQVRFLLSGNFLLSVFDDSDRHSPVITRRFHIVEPLTAISGIVKKSTFEGFRGHDQEIDFEVDYSRIRIQDPRTEVKIVVMQNSRTDNCLKNLSPLFVRDNQLSYDLSGGNVFPGGNEFRNFDTKDLRINGWGVANIDFVNPLYHITLQKDQVRGEHGYSQEGDINGRLLVKNDRVTDADLESDYMLVRFSIEMPAPISGGEIYVFGALSDWKCNPSNKMKWNPELKFYEATLMLKQGFYDYQYVYSEKGSLLIDSSRLEGSYVETENDYQIFVYHRGFASRYDKLIGFHTINSVKR